MNKMLYVPLAALALAAFASSPNASAQEIVVYAEAPQPPMVYVDPIPPVVVAGMEPVYYEGRPVYWYNNRWYFREGNRWSFYGREPRGLFERRGRPMPPPHYPHGGGWHHGGWRR